MLVDFALLRLRFVSSVDIVNSKPLSFSALRIAFLDTPAFIAFSISGNTSRNLADFVLASLVASFFKASATLSLKEFSVIYLCPVRGLIPSFASFLSCWRHSTECERIILDLALQVLALCVSCFCLTTVLHMPQKRSAKGGGKSLVQDRRSRGYCNTIATNASAEARPGPPPSFKSKAWAPQ